MITPHSHRPRIQDGVRRVARAIVAKRRLARSRNRLAAFLLTNGEVIATPVHRAEHVPADAVLFGRYGLNATPRLVAGDLIAAIREMVAQ